MRLNINHTASYRRAWLILSLAMVVNAVHADGSQPDTRYPPQSQSLAFFIDKALENNLQVKAETHGTGDKKHMFEGETSIMENPMFSFGVLNVPVNSFSLGMDPMTSMGFMISQTIALPAESLSRRQMAYQEYISQNEKLMDMRLMLVYQTTSLYHEMNYLLTKKNLLIQNTKALKDIVNLARTLVSVNKMNSSQLLRLEANLAQMESDIYENQAMVVKSEAYMEKLTRVKPEEDKLADAVSIWKTKPEEISIPGIFTVHNHPMYKWAESMVKKAEARKNNEGAKLFPSVTLSAEYMVRQPIAGLSMGDDMVSLRVSAPLPLFFPIKQSKAILAADEGLKEARDNLDQVKLDLLTQWNGEYEMAGKLLLVYKRYTEEVLPRYYASYKAQLGSLSSGTVSLTDVLSSYRDYLEVSIKEAEVYRDLQKSIAMLNYLNTVGVKP